MRILLKYTVFVLGAVTMFFRENTVTAQEHVTRLENFSFLKKNTIVPNPGSQRPAALSLPFFEDFSNYNGYPSTERWEQSFQVYVNNTMGIKPISRGVATFDGLNAKGLPYDTLDNDHLLYADTLMSLDIDLSSYQSSDSVYFSFYYQPEGNGFAPKTSDSLMLFMRSGLGTWFKMWAAPGTNSHDFRKVVIPVTNVDLFHSAFAFRFINKASIGYADNNWHIDYIELAANRSFNDTIINDPAFTQACSSYLKEYSSMPYRHFIADAANERAAEQHVFLQNSVDFAQDISIGRKAVETISGQTLEASAIVAPSVPFSNNEWKDVAVTNYGTTLPLTGRYDKVVFENTFFLVPDAASSNKYRSNDTIVQSQVFDNYLAYDDGTAEKSYFLNQFPGLPAKTAIEFHLNEPDTLKGISIYFGRQVPMGTTKYFTAVVYKTIAVDGQQDEILYSEETLFPAYDSLNHFWNYKFARAVPLPAGTFYIGTIQPSYSGSDSLYFGLDVNRQGSNHLYYSVVNTWSSSAVSGALMVRPLLGKDFTPSTINETQHNSAAFRVYPNPATHTISFSWDNNFETIHYTITDMSGRIVQEGKSTNASPVSVRNIVPGAYIISGRTNKNQKLDNQKLFILK